MTEEKEPMRKIEKTTKAKFGKIIIDDPEHEHLIRAIDCVAGLYAREQSEREATEIKRYKLSVNTAYFPLTKMAERKDGPWVRYEDYAALEARCRLLAEQLKNAESQLQPEDQHESLWRSA